MLCSLVSFDVIVVVVVVGVVVNVVAMAHRAHAVELEKSIVDDDVDVTMVVGHFQSKFN